MVSQKKLHSLLTLMLIFTFLLIAAQISFFLIHTKMSNLIDSLVNSSIPQGLTSLSVLLPLVLFLLSQVGVYVLLTVFIWFIAITTANNFNFNSVKTSCWAFLLWFMAVGLVFTLNAACFPYSFFSRFIVQNQWLYKINTPLIWFFSSSIAIIIGIAYYVSFRYRYHLKLAFTFLAIVFANVLFSAYEFIKYATHHPARKHAQPNVIIIGLDSVRPDHLGYFGSTLNTKTIDHLLVKSSVFTDAFTPLARTFPSWVSILTAKYPLHNQARNNLAELGPIVENDTIAKLLKRQGYETFYASDEKRFSNITVDFGFDHVIGPSMGVNDFLIGGLTDYPLTNLITTLPMAQWLFPYNYANRADYITYRPSRFVSLIQNALTNSADKPIFFAVHLCLSHWPYLWAHDNNNIRAPLPSQYKKSLEAVDQQLRQLLAVLKKEKLLENTIMVLLSDHGTALGKLGDRELSPIHYLGEKAMMTRVPMYKLLEPAQKKDKFIYETSYGQGNDLLSFTQQHVVLGIRGYGVSIPQQKIATRVALVDVAPTILDLINAPELNNIDGISLKSSLLTLSRTASPRPFFLETGDKIGEIETDKIDVNKVIKKRISSYAINQKGMLYLNPTSEKSLIQNKQRGVLYGDWLLVAYPPQIRAKFVPISAKTKEMKLANYRVEPFYILYHLKSHQWTLDLNHSFAKQAPINFLKRKLKHFYGDEMMLK